MFRSRSPDHRAKRYRVEARYLRGLVGTIPDADEKLVLAQIAEAYDDLADRLTGTPETAPPGG